MVMQRMMRAPREEIIRAARHFGIPEEYVTEEHIRQLPPRGYGLEVGRAAGVDVVKEAEIIVASLGAPNLDVAWNTKITGIIGLRNNTIDAVTPISTGYFLGRANSMYYFTYEGVDYYIGSKLDGYAKDIGIEWVVRPDTVAIFEGTWDALVWVAPTPMEGIKFLVWKSRAVIGLNKADVDTRLKTYDQKWFPTVLTVAAPPLAMEVTAFSFTLA